jgi:anti-anti-sigma factor
MSMGGQGLKALPRMFEVRIEQEPSAVFARLAGEFDLSAKEKFESEMAAVTGDLQPASLVLDLGGLTFIDSSGLRTIMELYGRSRDEGFNFAVRPGRREVQSVFELTGLDRVLPMVDTTGEHTRPQGG